MRYPILTRRWLLVALFALPALAEQSPELRISDASAREMPPGQTISAAFLTVANPGEQPVRLVSAACSCAQQVEMHRHEHSDGRVRMQRVDSVEVPANGAFRFQPGGYHLMLIGLQQPLQRGDNVELTLIDDAGGRHAVTAPVVVPHGAGHH